MLQLAPDCMRSLLGVSSYCFWSAEAMTATPLQQLLQATAVQDVAESSSIQAGLSFCSCCFTAGNSTCCCEQPGWGRLQLLKLTLLTV
jgi:hypothetical protein